MQSAFPADAAHLGRINDMEVQAETGGHLLLPLHRQGCRTHDHHSAGALAQQQFLDDKPSLDGLTETDVVSDQQIHPWHGQRARNGLELVVLDCDARTKGRLQHRGLGIRDRAPTQGVQKCTQSRRIVKPPSGKVWERGGVKDSAAGL